ncbi:ABC transporter permease [Kiloniella laminariae]|uniref:ABC transporter permease n=1 Tax=Kiloniella laminariae TaxID=454162 RepID=A0ABT4LH67_9PROT|nr:ABC transporter permease [Kiloniella laminariae]MCZ4280290.1 ABC transporter permease [Kiloniella laminariae]
MQIELREHIAPWRIALAPVAAVAVSLLLGSILILWVGASVSEAYLLLVKGALGSSFALTETFTRSIPLIFTGLAAAIAFRARFYNIGGEGQLYCGALAATFFGTGLVTLPPLLMIPFLMLVGALAGGAALAVPVLLKTHLKVDEVVTTLLLNFVILLFVGYLLEGPWKDPMSMGWPQSESIIDEGVFPKLVDKSRLHFGLLFAVIGSVLCWAMMRFTVWGYEIRAVGHNPSAARFSGINVNATVIRTALISGGFAGLAGVSEVAGLKGYLTLDISPGFGYTGIAVAMLAQLHPMAVILSALFISMIYVGADSMSRAVNIPTYIADVLVGLSVLSILVSVMLTRYRLRWR